MSFRNRLALFLMVTLVCVQAATAIFAYSWLHAQLVEQGKRELVSAMQAFTRQLDFLSQRATDGVQVLALDYAFRSAIAKSDHDTELSVLRNHGHRIGSARMMLVTLDGSIAADTAQATRPGAVFPYSPLLRAAVAGDRGTALVTLGSSIYWIVVVPVRAPIPIAFIAACIPLDDGLVEQMRRISSSPHAIMLATKAVGGHWRVVAHTRGDTGLVLPAIANGARAAAIVTQRESGTLAIVAPLRAAAGSRPIVAVIYFPLEEALRAYRGFITPMLIVLLLALLAAAGGATLIVRRVARPLEALASAAQRIAAGNYVGPAVPATGRDEIGHLAQAIGDMTHAIAERETALTGAMEAVELARVEAVRANETKSQFLANMSHELRTPLNAIVGFSEMLEQQVLGPIGTPRYLEYARDIHASGEHLRGLFERMLDLAQAESSNLSLSREPLAAGALVREAVEMHRGLARRGRVFVVLAPSCDSAQIVGDRTKLRQAFANVIHNAVKFSPPGGSVTVTSLTQAGNITVRISDTGAGIDPALLRTVLRPFHRLRSALDGHFQGAGLGLAFASMIVEMHGGTMSVESGAGEGTTVTIALPLAEAMIGHAA